MFWPPSWFLFRHSQGFVFAKPGTLKMANNEHGLCLWLVPTKTHLCLVKERVSKGRISQYALYDLVNLVCDCSEDSIHGQYTFST